MQGLPEPLFCLGGAAGYLIGNSINRQDAYTRGDVRAIGALTALNGTLGAFIYGDIIGSGEAEPGQWGWLCPAAGIISGTLIGQAWLKNADLTPRQGMTSIWSCHRGRCARHWRCSTDSPGKPYCHGMLYLMQQASEHMHLRLR